MEDIQPNLTGFIGGEDFFQKILVVESFDYVSELVERFPMSEIFFITPDEEISEKVAEKNFSQVKIIVMDYRDEVLPFDEEFFDLIIGDLTLEVVINPQDIAVGFSKFLKQTGVWLTSFRNIRHWKFLEKLMRGHFGGIVSRFYTRLDVVRVILQTFKTFAAQKKSSARIFKKTFGLRI